MNRLKKLFALTLALATCALAFAGCTGSSPAGTGESSSAAPSSAAPQEKESEPSPSQEAPKENLVVGLVASEFGTQSFNDDVLAGLELAEKELGVTGIPLEVSEVSDVANSLRTLIGQGATFLLVPASEYRDAMIEVAGENPQVKFLGLAEIVEGYDNILSLEYRENEGAFMAGALAGMMTKSNNVGAVLAVSEPVQYRYQAGFTAGVKAVNAACEVQTAFTNSYTDIGKGNEIAKIMYSKGADFVGTYAGACNLGVFNAARDAGDGKYCFGAANGQFDKMPDKILASVVKPVDQAILTILRDYIENGTFDASKPRTLGLKENGVTLRYTDNDALLSVIPDDVKAAMEDIISKVESGEIKVPATEEELSAFTYQYTK